VFTGLVEDVGRLAGVEPFAGGRRLAIASGLAVELHPGDSVAVSGICLTVERVEQPQGLFVVAAVEETLRRSTAARWRRGDRVHLERALAAGDRLGGHLVQGHVDGVARVVRAGRRGRDFVLALQIPGELRRYVVAQGSLAVDGISLTVAEVRGGICGLHIVPETLARTLVRGYRPGGRVNIEVDLVAKYVESLRNHRS
jgi:riboflavin synthase